jgi:two-component system response regulator TtrR
MIKLLSHIYIIDDDEAIRASLLLMLGSLGRPIQTFESGENYLLTVDVKSPGCLVLDLRMPKVSGIQVLDALLAAKSPQVVIFLSGHGDIPTALTQIKRGAFSWLEKPADGDALKREVYAGLEIAEQRAAARAFWETLTKREKEAAHFVAKGYSNKETARLLVPPVDDRTVATFRANLQAKLEIDNAPDLRGWMLKNMWLTDFLDQSTELAR